MSQSERVAGIAEILCKLTGERNRRGVQQLVSRWLWRERQREAADLGYADLGGSE